ncbi:MAG: MAE_28990/MAE_18760 family HEPN-like nuclease [Pseudomonadota bacterium]
MLANADLTLPSFGLHDRKLETLVRRRNKIAHGEKDMISDLSYYLQYEEAFTIVAYELVFAIENRLRTI